MHSRALLMLLLSYYPAHFYGICIFPESLFHHVTFFQTTKKDFQPTPSNVLKVSFLFQCIYRPFGVMTLYTAPSETDDANYSLIRISVHITVRFMYTDIS